MKPELTDASTDENHRAFNGALISDEKTREDAVAMTQFVERTREKTTNLYRPHQAMWEAWMPALKNYNNLGTAPNSTPGNLFPLRTGTARKSGRLVKESDLGCAPAPSHLLTRREIGTHRQFRTIGVNGTVRGDELHFRIHLGTLASNVFQSKDMRRSESTPAFFLHQNVQIVGPSSFPKPRFMTAHGIRHLQ